MVSVRDYLQKGLRRKNYKNCLRRSLLTGIISVFLTLIWVYYAADLSRPLFAFPVISREDKQDLFVRSTGPRVAILVMSDKIDEPLCYSVGSAYLSGLPVVVAGYGMPYSGFLSKLDFMEAAMGNAGLKPEDVAIVIDSDTFFTGADLNPFLDRFIAHSAATPEELDALAVRQGRAMAPLIANGEDGCWAPNLFQSGDECRAGFEIAYVKVREYAAAHPQHELALPFDLVAQRQLNAGVVITRVWAYKEFIQKVNNFTKTQTPRLNADKGWFCDQSIVSALYLDLLKWEIERDVFSLPVHERQAARSTYGIRAGFLGLDYVNDFTTSNTLFTIYLVRMHDAHWTKYLSGSKPERSHWHGITDFRQIGQFVDGLYRRAYATHGDKIYTTLAVPRWVGGRRASGVTHITLTPPLMSLKLRPIDTLNHKTRRTFPCIYHAAGQHPGHTKISQMELVAIGARWFVPMVYNETAKRQAMEYLASAPLLLSTNNAIIRDSYYTKCGFPFGSTIRRL